MLVFVKSAQLQSLVLKDRNNMIDITDMIIQLNPNAHTYLSELCLLVPAKLCRALPIWGYAQGVTQRDNGTRTPLHGEEDGRAGPSISHS
jgi:hypothetical protein